CHRAAASSAPCVSSMPAGGISARQDRVLSSSCSNLGEGGPHRQRTSVDEGRIGQEADHLAGPHLRDVLAEFDQSVGIRQRGQKSSAFARKLHGFEGTI